MKSVAVIVGSLRRESINRKFAHSLGRLAGERLRFNFVEIGDLPLYNEDLWINPPDSVLRFKRNVEAADAALFVTPEYNRSFTPAIKNAIDWGTRPWGKNSWADKPAAIIGASPGVLGTAAAQNALRGLLTVCDMVLMGQPEVYFNYRPELFDDRGDVLDLRTREFLDVWIDRFDKWIDLISSARRAEIARHVSSATAA